MATQRRREVTIKYSTVSIFPFFWFFLCIFSLVQVESRYLEGEDIGVVGVEFFPCTSQPALGR